MVGLARRSLAVFIPGYPLAVWVEGAKKEEAHRIEKSLEQITKGLGMYEKYKG